MAGNQLGKTLAGGMEAAMHLTGRYPDYWTGRRWNRPVRAWAGSETGDTTRDGVQKYLIGEPKDHSSWGTGCIPFDALERTIARQGIIDALDGAVVKHVSGGFSTIGFKTYEQGREKWQAETLDFVWYDEEPPPDIYTEGLTRTNATGGMAFMTFTPLKGMSEVVMQFYENPTPQRAIVRMTIDDVLHISSEQRQIIIDSYREDEREARTMGVPALGSGRVFPVTEASITVDSFETPDWWNQIIGLDFGWDHPTAAVKIAHNHEDDIVYVTHVYLRREATPLEHSVALTGMGGKFIPVAWPHDGLIHDKTSGQTLAEQYRKYGIKVLNHHATHSDGGHGFEAGVVSMLDRMRTGRFKVFRHLEEWFREFRLYHRKDGVVVKNNDDLMSATRIACMMLRSAKPGMTVAARRPAQAIGSESSYFS